MGRKVYKEYIKPENVEKVRAACAAYREERLLKRIAARRETTYVDNFRFLGAMLDRFDAGKTVNREQGNWLVRLHSEGLYITGRPAIRPRRRFMVPSFPNLKKWLPSREKMDAIFLEFGENAIFQLLKKAKAEYISALFETVARENPITA